MNAKAPTKRFDAMSAPELGHCGRDVPELLTLLGQALPQQRAMNDVEVQPKSESMGLRVVRRNARIVSRAGERPHRSSPAIEEVAQGDRAQKARRASENLRHVEDEEAPRQSELLHTLRISTFGELVAGLAHELNQPLSAIANGVEACARHVRSGNAEAEKLLALLEDASAEALRAGRIVQHLRGFIEKGKPQLERTDLCEIARNIPRVLSPEIEREHITLRVDLHPRPLPIYADGIQIEQIIVNLMRNAIDAIREAAGDHREIQFQVWAAKRRGEVAVRDSGAGVSDSARARMFEPFFTTKSHGLGMGLAISRSIIAAHGGRIWVQRRSDGCRGTTVRFSLPLGPIRTARQSRGLTLP